MKKHRAYLIIYLFLFIYNPPITSIMIIHLLTVYTVAVLFFKPDYQKEIQEIMRKSKLSVVTATSIGAAAYTTVISLINGRLNISGIYVYFITGIEIVVCAIYLCLFLRENEYDFIDFIEVLLIMGSIQAIIAAISFVYQPMQLALIHHMVYVGKMPEVYLLLTQRLFGLARGLTSTMAVVQAVFASIAVWLGINRKTKYFYYVPLLVFSGAINARVSLVVFLIGTILAVMYSNFKNPRAYSKIVLLAGIMVVSIIIMPILLQEISPGTYDWLRSGVHEVSAFIGGKKIGYFEVALQDSFLSRPEGLGLIFGTGNNIFGLENGSDIGYINDLWQVGIIMTTAIYAAVIYFYISTYNIEDSIGKFISALFVFTFLVFNIKGIAFGNSELTALTFLTIGYLNVVSTQENKQNILVNTKRSGSYFEKSESSYIRKPMTPIYMESKTSQYASDSKASIYFKGKVYSSKYIKAKKR